MTNMNDIWALAQVEVEEEPGAAIEEYYDEIAYGFDPDYDKPDFEDEVTEEFTVNFLEDEIEAR